ncbi:hypothetical protein CANARDRAFT_29677, partial [[Candida] arabinofermentans NRRL YB-2248]
MDLLALLNSEKLSSNYKNLRKMELNDFVSSQLDPSQFSYGSEFSRVPFNFWQMNLPISSPQIQPLPLQLRMKKLLLNPQDRKILTTWMSIDVNYYYYSDENDDPEITAAVVYVVMIDIHV